MDKNGRVIVRSLTPSLIRPNIESAETINQVISSALANRRTGNSNVHDQSSRSHAILICEIVNEELINTREAR